MSHPATIPSGVLIVNKRAGISSFDVIRILRRSLQLRHMGHTGTLDPFATGVLIIAVGSATRLIEYTHTFPKTYEVTIKLGATSSTDDPTGQITPHTVTTIPDRATIEQTLEQFVGTHEQVPPIYSAIKQQGEPVYAKARRGESVHLPSRSVTLYAITLRDYTYPTLSCEIRCSTGTYIRAFARDLGVALGTGAYALTLCRTAIGPWSIDNAKHVETITMESLPQMLQPASQLVQHLPALTLSNDNVAQLQQGRAVLFHTTVSSPVALYTSEGLLVGIGSYDPTQHRLLPHKILPLS